MKFPMGFEVSAKGEAGVSTFWAIHENTHPPIQCAIPAEFSGPGKAYTPESLLGAAILSCIIATYKFRCEKLSSPKIDFKTIEGKAIVTMNKEPSEPILLISQIEIYLKVTGASNQEQAKKALEEAIKQCPISNCIKHTTGKSYHLEVTS
jgi:uncharacterized OsmC-like protein